MPRSAKQTRSQYGAGTVVERSPNRWQLRVSLGTGPDGKHRRATKTVHATSRKAALAELAKFHSNRHGTRNAETLAGLFAEYLDSCHDMSPATLVDWEGSFGRYVTAHLKRRRLRDLTTRDLDGLYTHLLRQGGVCNRRGVDPETGESRKCTTSPCPHGAGRPLSRATVDHLHTMLHAALEQAVQWDYIPANPATRTREITVVHREVKLPPAEHLVKLLATIDELALDDPDAPGSPLPDFIALLLGSGARPGELCALPWGDVDLTRVKDGKRYGVLTINKNLARGRGRAVVKATKTEKERRVTVPSDVVAVLEARLARWRPAVLAAGIPLEQMAVFPSKNRPEQPWRPDSISRELRWIRDDLNLSEALTMRNLRHYCVSVLARGGVDVVTAAKRMGHSPTIMLGVYAHILDDADLEAADVLAANIARVRKTS